MAKFEAFCNPQKNVTWECHLFNTRNQQLGETINQYVTDLKTKAKSCEFGTLSGSLIRYLIIISRKTHDQISKRPLLKSKTELVTFSGHKLKACGKTSVVYEYKQKLNVVEFEVQQNVSSVLGLKNMRRDETGTASWQNQTIYSSSTKTSSKDSDASQIPYSRKLPMHGVGEKFLRECFPQWKFCHIEVFPHVDREHARAICELHPLLGTQAVSVIKISELFVPIQSMSPGWNFIPRNFPGIRYHLPNLKIDPNKNPVVHPPRRVPVTIRSKVKDELDCMTRLNVIKRVH